jgi:hypothetical protein
MTTRRQFLARTSLAMLGAAGTAFALPSETGEAIPDGSASKDMITPEADRAIARGLAYLSRSQHPDDGSFGAPMANYSGNVAITSLAGLAFMAGGHHPGRGVYGRNVALALDNVIGCGEKSLPKGYLNNPRGQAHGPMYGHGFGTLFLAEAHGMMPPGRRREQLAEMLPKAVTLIVKSQNIEGGWRYEPEPRDADLSVTICQIMALRAARNAGIYVPKNVVDRCVAYVKQCQDLKGGGWFRYQKQGGSDSNQAFARTAAGVCALYSAGIYQGPEITAGLEYLKRVRNQNGNFGGNGWGGNNYFFYGHYYAAQAMWTAGGSYWREWYPWIRDILVQRQKDGSADSWPDAISADYGTAMACIILQIPNNYLPIMQK